MQKPADYDGYVKWRRGASLQANLPSLGLFRGKFLPHLPDSRDFKREIFLSGSDLSEQKSQTGNPGLINRHYGTHRLFNTTVSVTYMSEAG
jgi:hypothetical protein